MTFAAVAQLIYGKVLLPCLETKRVSANIFWEEKSISYKIIALKLFAFIVLIISNNCYLNQTPNLGSPRIFAPESF